MKMIFSGWRRTVFNHSHGVQPLKGNYGTSPKRLGEPLEWASETVAYGKVNGLQLGGDFKVRFEFEIAELRNWLTTFVAKNPREAIPLLAEMQGAATLALFDIEEEEE